MIKTVVIGSAVRIRFVVDPVAIAVRVKDATVKVNVSVPQTAPIESVALIPFVANHVESAQY